MNVSLCTQLIKGQPRAVTFQPAIVRRRPLNFKLDSIKVNMYPLSFTDGSMVLEETHTQKTKNQIITLGWKLSSFVFHRWITLRNTTWLSFQADISLETKSLRILPLT